MTHVCTLPNETPAEDEEIKPKKGAEEKQTRTSYSTYHHQMLPSHVFSANPLSLSLPDSAFESWLRDKGYLEILDERTTARASIPTSSTAPSSPSNPHRHTRRSPALVLGGRIFTSVISVLTTVVSLVTISPFAKLTADDFAGDTPSWTVGFVGYPNSYSWPSDPSQARMRVHENVKRYARCYSLLALVFFACSLSVISLSVSVSLTFLGRRIFWGVEWKVEIIGW